MVTSRRALSADALPGGKDSRPIDVVVAGYLGVDLAPGFPADAPRRSAKELFRPGALIQSRGLSVSLGGAVANVGIALMKFGRRVAFMGSVGTDPLGDTVMSLLAAQGIPNGIRRDNTNGTAYGIVLAPPGMDRLFIEDPGCNARFCSDDIDFDVVRQSRLFHLGYPPLMERLWCNRGAELRRILSSVQEAGAATSLDMALPDPDSAAGSADWGEILREVMPHVDIFVPSMEEIVFMLEPTLYRNLRRRAAGRDIVDLIPTDIVPRLANKLLAMGAKIVMIKAGHHGAYISTHAVDDLISRTGLPLPVLKWDCQSFWAKPWKINRRELRNASGAGDCAVAGFLAAILSGAEVEQTAAYAMLAGRDNLYGVDACSGLRDWGTMTRDVKRLSTRGVSISAQLS